MVRRGSRIVKRQHRRRWLWLECPLLHACTFELIYLEGCADWQKSGGKNCDFVIQEYIAEAGSGWIELHLTRTNTVYSCTSHHSHVTHHASRRTLRLCPLCSIVYEPTSCGIRCVYDCSVSWQLTDPIDQWWNRAKTTSTWIRGYTGQSEAIQTFHCSRSKIRVEGGRMNLDHLQQRKILSDQRCRNLIPKVSRFIIINPHFAALTPKTKRKHIWHRSIAVWDPESWILSLSSERSS